MVNREKRLSSNTSSRRLVVGREVGVMEDFSIAMSTNLQTLSLVKAYLFTVDWGKIHLCPIPGRYITACVVLN